MEYGEASNLKLPDDGRNEWASDCRHALLILASDIRPTNPNLADDIFLAVEAEFNKTITYR